MSSRHAEADTAVLASRSTPASSAGSDYLSFGGMRMSSARELNHSSLTGCQGERPWQSHGEAFRFIESEEGGESVTQRSTPAAPVAFENADGDAPRQWAVCGVAEAGRAGCEETALFLCSRCDRPVCVRHRRFWMGRLCCPTCQNRALRSNEANVVCSMM
mmetsp:Transcript_12571/g.23205  ORF Transcript_12571/g.23205 Transcript_12571/m.23205 type:complete len:160 (-) Transcript_12571:90-569(-)